MSRSGALQTIDRRRAARWRWYHFYFILALFDLAVILASLWLYHQTLTSYQVALVDLGAIDTQQRWLTHLRLTLLDLNAPGNDVFASRDVKAEQHRFERTCGQLRTLMDQDRMNGVDLGSFRTLVGKMTEDEERIFDRFEAMAGLPQAEQEQLLAQATVSMAAMDRSQAEALAVLADAERALFRSEDQALGTYGAKLARSAAFEKWFLATVVLILIGVFWYGRKLQQTHERMIEDQQRALEERHARLAAVGEVCSAVAHGIRNPLAAITSSAQLALEFGTLDDTTKLRLRDVLAESQRLNRRVTRLLDFSRGPRGAFQACDLREIIEQAAHELKVRLKDSDVTLCVESVDERLNVHGDHEGLVLSVIELLSNSMDHLRRGGKVCLRCRRHAEDPQKAVISVTDDGPGFPENILPHVFDLFVTSKADGHGIGLASVRRIAELHGGTVSAASTNGKGAHVEIVLPLA